MSTFAPPPDVLEAAAELLEAMARWLRVMAESLRPETRIDVLDERWF